MLATLVILGGRLLVRIMRRNYYLLLVGLLLPLGYSAAATSNDTPEAEHRTADGRPISLTREECQKLIWPQQDIDVAADCLEAEIYNLCDEAWTPLTGSLCYATVMEVAERRIVRAERKLVQSARTAREAADIKSALTSSRTKLKKRVDGYCKERARLWIKAEKKYGQPTEYPTGVDVGQGFEDCIIEEKVEWARELESFVAELSKTKYGFLGIRKRLLNFLNGKSPLYTRPVGR
jgi:hypothetical protein